jgi:hypothetical protein
MLVEMFYKVVEKLETTKVNAAKNVLLSVTSTLAKADLTKSMRHK